MSVLNKMQRTKKAMKEVEDSIESLTSDNFLASDIESLKQLEKVTQELEEISEKAKHLIDKTKKKNLRHLVDNKNERIQEKENENTQKKKVKKTLQNKPVPKPTNSIMNSDRKKKEDE